MDNSNFKTSSLNKDQSESHVSEAASQLLNEGKKYANELYEQGKDKVSDAQDSVKEYSDSLMKVIHENPLTSVLIAAGVGMLISSIFRK
ncbi:MAG: hypothetical protein K2X39_07715 [Silvanigrellaceae bacterium]|nr:hypothetical protein [Silvanigrellaceae bacterium]